VPSNVERLQVERLQVERLQVECLQVERLQVECRTLNVKNGGLVGANLVFALFTTPNISK